MFLRNSLGHGLVYRLVLDRRGSLTAQPLYRWNMMCVFAGMFCIKSPRPWTFPSACASEPYSRVKGEFTLLLIFRAISPANGSAIRKGPRPGYWSPQARSVGSDLVGTVLQHIMSPDGHKPFQRTFAILQQYPYYRVDTCDGLKVTN